MPANHGPFIWYEYAATDKDRAADFYAHVVPWTVSTFEVPGMPYTVFNAPDGGVGGLAERMEGQPGGWIGYVAVADVDETVAAYQANGGSVEVPAMDIPEVGRFAILADPGGARLAVMKPLSTEMWKPDHIRMPGHAGWHELFAHDGPQAFDFYAKVFGWGRSTGMDMGPMGTYQLFSQDGMDIGGIMTMTPQMPAPLWNFYFIVNGVDAAADRAREKGASLLMGPHQVPGGGWVVQMADPEGQLFSLLSSTK